MIREEEGGLRIVNLDLRCIAVLCGCATKALPQRLLRWSLSVLRFLECSGHLTLLRTLYFCKFLLSWLKNPPVLLELSHFLLTFLHHFLCSLVFQRIPPQPTAQLPPSTLQWIPLNLRFISLNLAE